MLKLDRGPPPLFIDETHAGMPVKTTSSSRNETPDELVCLNLNLKFDVAGIVSVGVLK